MSLVTCEIEECYGVQVARGWCNKHYRRWRRNGDPLKISRSENGKGNLAPSGYRRFGVKGRRTTEHVLIAEKALGRVLPIGAIVHHVNGHRSDNRTSNLVICESTAYHALLHQRMRAKSACGNASWRKCVYCKQYGEQAGMVINTQGKCFHRPCRTAYGRRLAAKQLVR